MLSNKEEISNWLSQERRWQMCLRWMHDKGRRVSYATLRRAFKTGGATARQRLAIELAAKYYGIVTGPSSNSNNTTSGARIHSVPV